MDERPGATRYTNTGQPITEIAPAKTGTLSSGTGGAAVSSVSISPAYTLFALTGDTSNSGDLLQIDTQPDALQVVVRTLATGQNLRAAAVSPGNQFLYAISSGSLNSSTVAPSVRIVDLTSFQEAGSIPLPAGVFPNAAALTPDGNYLYVAGFVSSAAGGISCHVIDTTTRTLVKTLSFSGGFRPVILMSPDGGRVFLTTGDGIAVVDILTQTLSHTIALGAGTTLSSVELAIDPSATSLYVAPVLVSPGFGVAVYDLATSTNSAKIPVADLTSGMAMSVSADGAYLAIDQIVPDPATGLNDFPVVKFFSLADYSLIQTNPWAGPRDTPVTPRSLIPVPVPQQ